MHRGVEEYGYRLVRATNSFWRRNGEVKKACERNYQRFRHNVIQDTQGPLLFSPIGRS